MITTFNPSSVSAVVVGALCACLLILFAFFILDMLKREDKDKNE